MLLDRIDIDEHGPLNRVELGPLGEQLNVVFAPIGSGKTAIARFIRDTLIERDYPTGMLSSSTGRVVWATGTGLVHCHREQDGTRQGRQRIQFEPRGAADLPYHSLQSSWLDSIGPTPAMQHSRETIDLPESVVDGIITDTSVSNAAKIVAACLSQGLEKKETYRDLPLAGTNVASPNSGSLTEERREQLRAELASVDAELARIGEIREEQRMLIRRRDSINSKLARWNETDQFHHLHDASTTIEQLQRRGNELQTLARQLRSRQTELRGWINDLEKQLDSRRAVGAATLDLQEHLNRSRQDLVHLTAELDTCLADASDVRHSMCWTEDERLRSLRYSDDYRYPENCRDHRADRYPRVRRDALLREQRDIEEKLTTLSRRDWLIGRQNELRYQLGQHTVAVTTISPLASLASQWLARVSGGRLNRIDWSLHESTRTGLQHRQGVAVQINGRPETEYASPDRALAALAIRLSAGELLARVGRRVPLVVETQREMWQTQHQLQTSEVTAYCQPGKEYRYNHPLVAALRDYASNGHQVLVLTSDQHLMTELSRTGARQFDIHPQHIVHGHHPLWRHHYGRESYVGPHPHVIGQQDLDPFSGVARSRTNSVDQINYDLDLASSYAEQDERETVKFRRVVPAPRTAASESLTNAVKSHPVDLSRYRDGYYYADRYTTLDAEDNRAISATPHACGHCGSTERDVNATIKKPESPFLLSVDSPIDQAPSIDAVAAAKLRGLNVTHVTHLMQQDANRLSDALGFATVDASTVRRWQAESRLCCRVPQLRNFDARILVGCGITTPAQLAAIHPTDLLRDVESFLATEQGQKILRSGSSQELVRITTWIATANSGVQGDATLPGQVVRRGGIQTDRVTAAQDVPLTSTHQSHDAEQYRRESARDNRRVTRGQRQRSRATNSPTRNERKDARRSRGGEKSEGVNGSTSVSRRRQRRVIDAEPQRFSQEDRRQGSDFENSQPPDVVQYETSSSPSSWKFYLDRESPVEAAPAIGDRMAERLAAVEIHTVNDLLEADPELVAEELNHRRVDADTVVEWQQQATLVCCVPMLRGHDAQLLVAAEITTADELSVCDAEELFAIIDPISNSKQGARIIRGGKLPDLAEVTNWIAFAQHTRELKAA